MEEASITDLKDEVFIVTDPRLPNKPIVYVDERFANFVGYTVEEMVGQNAKELLQRGITSERSKVLLIDTLQNGQTKVFEMLNFKKDGTPFINKFRLIPFYGSDDTISFLVGKHISIKTLFIDIATYSSLTIEIVPKLL